MSWTDNIETELIITTGDGKQYKPLWIPTSKDLEYNIAEFEFPEVNGTLVKKGTPKGRKFPLEVYFQGEDYLVQSDAFEVSARDQRPWVVLHPYYGNITVQPASLSFDNSKYNSAKITGVLLETITEDNPKTVIDPIDTISLDKESLDKAFVAAFDVAPSVSDINTLKQKNSIFYTLGAKIISLASESENYFNLFNEANAAVLNATALPLQAIMATQALINAPALFEANVRDRLILLSTQFNSLRDSLSSNERSGKKIYESSGGAFISSMAIASANPLDGNYKNMTDVLLAIEQIITSYNFYLEDLDSIQTENGGLPDSYIPDASSLIGLSALVNLTISNLYKIALNSRSERSIVLEDDSNWVVLTHRFYGLDPLDNNLKELIENNSAGLNEMLQVRKGRKIIYYI